MSNSSDNAECSRLTRSKSVNADIIKYYLKFAKGRDIEKFMRLSSSYSSRSECSDDNECILAIIESDKSSDRCIKSDEKEEDYQAKEFNEFQTKNSKRLEWDALADVGYKKASSTSNITSVERSMLKELFNDSPSEPNISRKCSNECSDSADRGQSSADKRERWRRTLETLSQKYSSTSGDWNTSGVGKQPQSTPKPDVEKSCQTTFDKKKSYHRENNNHADRSAQTSFAKNTPRPIPCADKFLQTSIIKLKSQDAQTSVRRGRDSSATTTPSSFVFQQCKSNSQTSSSSTRRSILSERNSNTTSSPISLESDKENKFVGPPIISKNEVDLGIKLLCSLIDSKKLSKSQKKELAKKIFTKITKRQSDSPSSASLISVSNELSENSLIENTRPSQGKPSNRDITPQSEIHHIEPKQQKSVNTQTDYVAEGEYQQSESTSQEDQVTMREWLRPLTRSEKLYEKKCRKKVKQSSSSDLSERQKQLTWIDSEILRLEGLKNLLIQERSSPSGSRSSKPKSSGKAEEIIEETPQSSTIDSPDKVQKSTDTEEDDQVIYDVPTGDLHKKSDQTKCGQTTSSRSSSGRNHRSKLETPQSAYSEGDVSAFANELQKRFMEKYKKKDQPGSEHYSEPRLLGKSVFTKNASYTSAAASPSSAFTVSSEMSIPMGGSSSTSGTSQEYEEKSSENTDGVAVQTSNSVTKTQPIFGPDDTRPTTRVQDKSTKIVQVKPQSLSYVITFDKPSMGSDDKTAKPEQLTLQQHLQKELPDFYAKANKRREILKKLHTLRLEREKQLREIANSSSVNSIVNKLEQLPPPPIKQARIGPTKEIKRVTKRRYSKLSEVVEKKEREKTERHKRSTRILTHIFNKKLQGMVHQGKLSLEHSRMVL